MSSVVLKSMNGFDLGKQDLETLASEMRGILQSIDEEDTVQIQVDVAPTYGSGNALLDTLIIVIPTLDFIKEAVYGKLIDVAVDFMKARFRRPYEATRPKRITIVGAMDPDSGIHILLENMDADVIEIKVKDGRRAVE